jgi:hypothetical protein
MPLSSMPAQKNNNLFYFKIQTPFPTQAALYHGFAVGRRLMSVGNGLTKDV